MRPVTNILISIFNVLFYPIGWAHGAWIWLFGPRCVRCGGHAVQLFDPAWRAGDPIPSPNEKWCSRCTRKRAADAIMWKHFADMVYKIHGNPYSKDAELAELRRMWEQKLNG